MDSKVFLVINGIEEIRFVQAAERRPSKVYCWYGLQCPKYYDIGIAPGSMELYGVTSTYGSSM